MAEQRAPPTNGKSHEADAEDSSQNHGELNQTSEGHVPQASANTVPWSHPLPFRSPAQYANPYAYPGLFGNMYNWQPSQHYLVPASVQSPYAFTQHASFSQHPSLWHHYGQGLPPSTYQPAAQMMSRHQDPTSQHVLGQEDVQEESGQDSVDSNAYNTLHLIRCYKDQSWRINKHSRASTEYTTPASTVFRKRKNKAEEKGQAKNGSKAQKPLKRDAKIMLPPPQPTEQYLAAATLEPFVIDPPQPVLVVLDLNGTLIYRPNRHRPTHLIARPFLKPFLRYLFENFAVMVWSSAKPANVNPIVKNVLDEDLQSMLTACWGRDTFGLAPHHYSMNVQVYKDLSKIWSSTVQEKHPDYEYGGCFGQHNTVLIDDSALKANAQPHNLIEVPEFLATPEQMKEDVLREVAGYLNVLKMQTDVSTFIKKWPFKADGTWMLDWDDATAEGGELDHKVSLQTN